MANDCAISIDIEARPDVVWSLAGDPGRLVYSGAMIYRFGSFELDIAKMELRLDGKQRAVEPQVFALLAVSYTHLTLPTIYSV